MIILFIFNLYSPSRFTSNFSDEKIALKIKLYLPCTDAPGHKAGSRRLPTPDSLRHQFR